MLWGEGGGKGCKESCLDGLVFGWCLGTVYQFFALSNQNGVWGFWVTNRERKIGVILGRLTSVTF